MNITYPERSHRWWFDNFLPEPYRSQALKNCDLTSNDFEVSSLLEALSGGFLWDVTKEDGQGHNYWEAVSCRVVAGDFNSVKGFDQAQSEEITYGQRLEAAKYLNTRGYDIEIDKDGLWLEDYRFQDCKTKEIVDHMIEYAQKIDPNTISDGYHTFGELYEARMVLTAALFNLVSTVGIATCKSWNHSDGQPCFGGGWFIVMANLPSGQVSFHYPEKDWDRFRLPEERNGWEWDGHETKDVYDRLLAFGTN